jgi:hypothetical protein
VPAQPVGHGEQLAARVRGVLVVGACQADVGPYRVAHGQLFLSGRCHDCVPSRQVPNEEGRELSPGRGLRFDPLPVSAEHERRVRRRQRAHRPDLRQRHPQPAQPRHQPGLLELRGRVEPVPRLRVNPGRGEQTELVVQAQRLAREPGRAGELTAAHQCHVRPPQAERGRPARSGSGLPQGRGQGLIHHLERTPVPPRPPRPRPPAAAAVCRGDRYPAGASWARSTLPVEVLGSASQNSTTSGTM